MIDGRTVLSMDENEKIDEIKEKILDTINVTLDRPMDVQRSITIKNLVDSYDILNNTQEEI